MSQKWFLDKYRRYKKNPTVTPVRETIGPDMYYIYFYKTVKSHIKSYRPIAGLGILLHFLPKSHLVM